MLFVVSYTIEAFWIDLNCWFLNGLVITFNELFVGAKSGVHIKDPYLQYYILLVIYFYIFKRVTYIDLDNHRQEYYVLNEPKASYITSDND